MSDLAPDDLTDCNTSFGPKEKAMTTSSTSKPTSVWSPLQVPRFRAFWIGMSLSTTAFWMQNIAVTWLMRSWIGGDAVMISLVQTALFLPVMLLSLPAGTIADMFDRRRFLIFSQVWMMLAPLAIAGLAVFQIESPAALLACTVLLAIGNAMKLPSQSALLPSLIDKDRLPFAIGLNSMAVNGGRIIGPALAGALLPVIGAMSLFLGNSVIYLLYVGILLRLPMEGVNQKKNTTSFLIGLVALKAWVMETPSFGAILIRGSLYFCVWSTVLAVVPLITENASEFGVLYGLFGFGAVAGASLYGFLVRVTSRTAALTVAILLHALCIALLSVASTFLVMAVLMALIGVASFFIMTTFQVCAQLQLPYHIRGRGLALMTTVFMGATALSSQVWGVLSDRLTPEVTLQIAGAFSVLCALVFFRRQIER